ncbi:hypothetical protein CCAL13119_05210 [Campylobacter sp. RM13119]|uniref:hypothetical protein n=1 Tax=Campylobacter californiensis TaxID=1032243 RepID=UPI001475F3B0|nr:MULTISPECIES: hypothetical protein [unclassified Campylobacter]MBE3606359.1 hypothetical protein [Campylobacter sp. RM13119]MBE3609445.1 hypothetical protein [Campylobacter sp. RM12916]
MLSKELFERVVLSDATLYALNLHTNSYLYATSSRPFVSLGLNRTQTILPLALLALEATR